MEKVYKRILYAQILATSCVHLSPHVWLHDMFQSWFRWVSMQGLFTRNMWNHNCLPAESWDNTDVRQSSWVLLRVLEHLWLTSHNIILRISNSNFHAQCHHLDKDCLVSHCAIHIRQGDILHENIRRVQLLGGDVNPSIHRPQILPNVLHYVHYNICRLTFNRHWQKSWRRDDLWKHRPIDILLDGI